MGAYSSSASVRVGRHVAAVPSSASRWVVAGAGVILQSCLGTVYAWSFFQSKLALGFGWSQTATALAFSVAMFTLGLAAATGGVLLPRIGPRRLALAGATLYGAGQIVAAAGLAGGSVALFIFGYGVVGGVGLGLGYVTPVATVSKWFPDKRGLVTGLVVMGFGLGALLMSKLLATQCLDAFMPAELARGDLAGAYRSALPQVFLTCGLALGVVGACAALLLRDPPAGYVPPGYVAPAQASAAGGDRAGRSPLACLLSARFALMWVALFCNVTAGIMFIAFQAPMLEDLLARQRPDMGPPALAAAGAMLVGVSAVFNGLGRLVWGGLSDRIGRENVYRLIFATQIVALATLLRVSDPWVFAAIVCYVLLCYGGGFGTAPSLVADAFGTRVMPVAYGMLLTAWSIAGLVGPQVVALLKDADARTAAARTFECGIVILAVGLLASTALSSRGARDQRARGVMRRRAGSTGRPRE
jgi:OFA family oxalate/formate antiporter-like MFS transporter